MLLWLVKAVMANPY